MRRKARVVIIQSDHDCDDPADNLAEMQEQVDRHQDADLIVFPELALHGHRIAAEPRGALQRHLAATPEEDFEAFVRHIGDIRADVVAGALVERNGGLYNIAFYTDGTHQVTYAKTHVHWSETFTPGVEFPVVETPIGTLGMLICFDAAFAEVPRILALHGAHIVVNLSAIPEHFPIKFVHRRLQACSVENQVYTIFANRTGRGFDGGSAVVDPMGEMVAVAGKDEGHLECVIDMDALFEWREREPLLRHRRPELYGLLSYQPRQEFVVPKTPK